MRHLALVLFAVAAWAILCFVPPPSPALTEEVSAAQLFKERILPIFRSPDPSSCTECHLAAVELADYVRPTARETFLSLRDLGLVDVDVPEKSRILEMIRMAPESSAKLPSQRRAEELAAFEAWILASARDPELRDAAPLAPKKLARPKRPDAVIRHARKSRVLDSFERLFWSDIERCASCHMPPGNIKKVKKHGKRVSWIVPGDPEATLERLMKQKLLDLKKPEKSKVLRKPTLQEEHKGGQKMIVGDETYVRWLAWITDYAKTLADGYRSAEKLPAPEQEDVVLSNLWIRIDSTKSWKGNAAKIEIFAWDARASAFESTRCASTVRQAGPKGVQHRLFIIAPSGSDRARTQRASKGLPPGKYLIRLWLDRR
ncbi:MAG: hypothetical protein O7E54_00240, partial [Planctomycetota bacterium]|nr:hypothetical protein [Planctomycetota bacterium]